MTNALTKPEHIGSALKSLIKEKHENSLFKNEGLKIYDELRYEYYRMEIPGPLSECMISRFRMAQHQLPKTCKAIQEIEKTKQQTPLHIVELMEHMKINVMISTGHTCYNQQKIKNK